MTSIGIRSRTRARRGKESEYKPFTSAIAKLRARTAAHTKQAAIIRRGRKLGSSRIDLADGRAAISIPRPAVAARKLGYGGISYLPEFGRARAALVCSRVAAAEGPR
ncbi:hypothetical protein EVAR_76366_1 [Eumeta japonica]|uniref:Uncharacterized protein n=1 Tax=Eumeta variegata TaxID=151549 RepID=A0A4C1T8L5_EUMVA|nr:hypothetical protein EVAR_76366_1 [Eumeta japonica]